MSKEIILSLAKNRCLRKNLVYALFCETAELKETFYKQNN